MTILQITTNSKIELLSVPTSIVQHCRLFNDLFSYFGDTAITVPFPSDYNDVVASYVNFLSLISINATSDSGDKDEDDQYDIFDRLEDIKHLSRLLLLSHYLGDTALLNFLVSYMQGHMSTSSKSWSNDYVPLIRSLHSELQREIYLRLPLYFVPVPYCDNQKFIDEWVTANISASNGSGGIYWGTQTSDECHVVTYAIENHFYITRINFYDEQKSDLRDISCWRMKSGTTPDRAYTHGLKREWSSSLSSRQLLLRTEQDLSSQQDLLRTEQEERNKTIIINSFYKNGILINDYNRLASGYLVTSWIPQYDIY